MKRETISTKKASGPFGPYSQAVKTGSLVFTAGQIPVDPETGEISGSDIKTQTETVIKNIKAVLEASGSSLDKVVKTTCFLKDLNDCPGFNEVYESWFKPDYPSRTMVEVSKIPRGSLVEIEAVAVI